MPLAVGMPHEAMNVSAEESTARADAYALLAAFLREPPGMAVLGIVRDIDADAARAGDPLGNAWHMLRLAGETADPAALEFEYNQLFIGIGRGELVPFASWYQTGMLNDQPLIALRRDLAELGFARRRGTREPEDHAGALMEIMGLMAGAPEQHPITQQQTFFANHLEPWLGRFFTDLRKAEAARFYRAVGTLGAAFTDFEAKYLKMPV